MWVFYMISLPLTMGMVWVTLWYFAGPDVPRYVLFTVCYTWFCSLSIIIIVPADIWTTITDNDRGGISFFWSWSYWSTFLLTWAVVPIIQGYEDAGDFTMQERLRTSLRVNLVFNLSVASVPVIGLIVLIILNKTRVGNLLGFAMACSNTFGLVTGAFLLGFGLSEIPKGIWKNTDWTTRQKVLSHKVAKMAVALDDAHQEFSNSIVVAQATSQQMSKRDPLRPFMNIIDKMLVEMLANDPSFKPQGGRLGESDMDFNTDEKTMAALRRQLKVSREKYYRYRSEYMNFVSEALELEDIVKNYEHRSATGWKYISSFRTQRSGRVGPIIDIIEMLWRCLLQKQLEKLTAVTLGCMSAATILAEATILPSGIDLSLFSILINGVKKDQMLVQVAALIPLMYMCICTYYSLLKIGMLTFYSLTPGQTSSVSLLMICSMVARYAPPISYNYLNLIHLDGGAKTIFEKRMGNIDDAVPFFGKGFNKIYPLIMVIYTVLLATNFFDHVISYFGNWKIFRLQSEEEETLDGFDPSGIIILQKERSWLEQGHKVGELVVPLAGSFSNVTSDLEPVHNNKVLHENKSSVSLMRNGENQMKSLTAEAGGAMNKASTSRKYTPVRAQNVWVDTDIGSPETNTEPGPTYNAERHPDPWAESSSRLASTWESMKFGFQNFKATMEAKKFVPLHEVQDGGHTHDYSSESLDQIFEKLSRSSNPRGQGR